MTIQLAINYSREAAALLQEGKIAFNIFKAPDWRHLIDEAKQHTRVAVHFSLKAGAGTLHETDWEIIRQLGAETGTPFVNLHITSEMTDFPEMDQEEPAPAHRQKLIDMLRKDFEAVLAHFDASQVIAENVPIQGKSLTTIRTCGEPEVIHQLIEEYDTGLLLDVSHARIAAHTLGMEPMDYMACLPTRRIREMHFAGIHTLEGRLVDHLSVTPADLDLLAQVLDRIHDGQWSKPWMMAFEYGGVGGPFSWRTDREAIARDVPVLFQMLNRQERQGIQ